MTWEPFSISCERSKVYITGILGHEYSLFKSNYNWVKGWWRTALLPWDNIYFALSDETSSESNHWQTIFKWCSQVFGGQTSSSCQGLQLGGQITLQGKKAVVTCFHGLNFRSSSWALFTLREPHIQFETNAFELPAEQGQKSSKTLVVQNLLFDLGHNQTQREDGWLAMIHRVYRNEKSHFPFNGTIDECFQYVSAIKCPDGELPFFHVFIVSLAQVSPNTWQLLWIHVSGDQWVAPPLPTHPSWSKLLFQMW